MSVLPLPLPHQRLDLFSGWPCRRSDCRLRCMDAAVTPWPLFVYDIFDYRRMRRIIEDYFRTMSLGQYSSRRQLLSAAPYKRYALFRFREPAGGGGVSIVLDGVQLGAVGARPPGPVRGGRRSTPPAHGGATHHQGE